jgi:hypothetical protein
MNARDGAGLVMCARHARSPWLRRKSKILRCRMDW